MTNSAHITRAVNQAFIADAKARAQRNANTFGTTYYVGKDVNGGAYVSDVRPLPERFIAACTPAAPRHHHDFSDGDVCNGCDALRGGR